jgi:D-beta-D-heptose 7-phosphate kinase/D-beta-D-heptose 1-phosphate adenosyltransferase
MNKRCAYAKIVAREALAPAVAHRQGNGEQGVFTNGCFDLLHLGHIRYLQEARALGDFLILGLNGDESVAFHKGAGRPLVPAVERAEILAALACVDYVTIFPETTANVTIELLQPLIYVKGGDYAGAQEQEPDLTRLPEVSSVLLYGGSIRLIPYLSGHSTTELVAAIKQLPGKMA